ncbi:MAG TPA: TIGR02757 family protein [Planctomycetota bacterium]|nr:TIGR02757 family protein [Planctomycetota bacterium]HRR80869.1 TIGR02757 family protein [Planctomycetota bacterium]HRT94724.1 TIGR02757 family protein [Planctomycetota bacterium]
MAHATAEPRVTKSALEELYTRLNRRDLIHPDPLEVLYDYSSPLDREIVALVAASLSYGRVKAILASVGAVLAPLRCPRAYLAESTPESLQAAFADFKHRFATGRELAALLLGVKRLVERHGSLQAAFTAHLAAGHATIVPALTGFVAELRDAADGLDDHLLPRPERGSASKRLNLFLRWMVRRDAVDPGGWDAVSPAQLIVPLDVHMHRICRALGLTRRASADLRTAIEITDAFKAFAPDDPARYDFALTRLGIRPDADLDAFLAAWGVNASPERIA